MSLLFGGAAGHNVSLGNPTSLNNLATYTYILWFYPTTLDVSGGLVCKGIQASGNRRSFERRDSVTDDALFSTVDCATSDAIAESAAGTVVANTWQCAATTYDDTSKGIKIYYGTLSTPIAEVSYAIGPTAGSGAAGDNSGNNMFIGLLGNGTSGSLPQSIAVVGIFNRVLSLGEMRAWQFNPRSLSGCVFFSHLGYNGASTQPDWSGNGNNGTVTGATQAAHIPLTPIIL